MTEEQLQKRRAKNAERMRAWREANPELAKERMRAFEAKNRERRIAYKAELRAANPEHFKTKHREASAKARAEKPEAIAAYRAEWLGASGDSREARRVYESARDKRLRAEAAIEREKIPPSPLSMDEKAVKHREYMRDYNAKNAERVRLQKRLADHKRRAAKKAGGTFTRAEWCAVCAQSERTLLRLRRAQAVNGWAPCAFVQGRS